MNIKQLQYFKEIVDQGSISKAAKVLHMAQPPLSQQLKKLETELGTVLILRYREKWELTETGKVLYDYAEKLLANMYDIKLQITAIEEGSAGTLRIGVSSACLNLLVDTIGTYRAQFPNIKIIIEKGNSGELLKKLDQKEIDLALLLRLKHTEKYVLKTLEKQDYVVIAPRSWGQVFSSGDVTFKEIGRYPFIMLGAMDGHAYYENILRAFEKEHVKANFIIESKDITTVIAMVSKGLGLSIIPRMAYAVPMEEVMIHELKQFDFQVEPVLIRAKDDRVSNATLKFWDLIE